MSDYRKFYTPEELLEMEAKDPDGGLQSDYRKFYTPEEFLEMGGWKYPQEYLDIMKNITNGIVPEGSDPTAESLETARQIYRSETKNREGGELFNLYARTRYQQLTDPNMNISPKLKAKLYEELVTIVNVIDQTIRKDSSLAGGWGTKASIPIGTNSSIDVGDMMKNLYVNRVKYGLPEYLHLPVTGNTQAPWGVLDPNRTSELCPITNSLSALSNSSFSTIGVASAEEVRKKLYETPEEKIENFKKQSAMLQQAEQEWLSRQDQEMSY